MKLEHIALVCQSEAHSDRFYGELLGLTKTRSKVLSADLAQQIFHLNQECTLIHYESEDLHFEVFIVNQQQSVAGKFEHLCLQVADLDAFLATCREMELNILRIPKGDGGVITFISDYDGNLFEIM